MGVPVYLLFGGDEYCVTSKAREIVQSLVPPEDQALGLEIIEGRADTVAEAEDVLDRACQALRTVGFLRNLKLVWLRDVNFLVDNVIGRSKAVKTRLNALTAIIKSGLLPGQVLVLSSPRVDKRYSLFKSCREAGEIHQFEIPEKSYLADKQAAERLRECLRKAGLEMSEDARQAFLERVGADTRVIVGEVDKLATFLGDRHAASRADVEAVTCSARGVLAWDLADAFGRRELPRAMRILRQLIFQRESPIGLIVTLESRIRELMVHREAIDRGWLKVERSRRGNAAQWSTLPPAVEAVFSEVFSKDPRKTHPYRVGLLAQQAGRFSMEELKMCQQNLVDAHTRLVTGSVPAALTLELLLIGMLA
jgi:DNA polymerase-3 subunit delta